MARYGSSPRGRGTPDRVVAFPDAGRFIPARAGNTPSITTACRPSTVHPRAGGEHSVARSSSVSWYGSSPRGRGTRCAREGHRRSRRFIPARAGNTRAASVVLLEWTVHPRAGGEHFVLDTEAAIVTGSSPRGRGTPQSVERARNGLRFIPARAGNTRPRTSRATRATVHPRAGGEHPALLRTSPGSNGSSPRGRGTLERAILREVIRRFIPARAGNTTGSGTDTYQ